MLLEDRGLLRSMLPVLMDYSQAGHYLVSPITLMEYTLLILFQIQGLVFLRLRH